MNDLLFYALLAALLYYFFLYLPSQKKVSRPILTQSQSTQTEPTLTSPDPAEFKQLTDQNQALLKDQSQKEKTIIGLNASYEKLEQKTSQQIKELQSQVRELAKRPARPTNSKSTQTDDKDLEDTLDTLIKSIQELNNEL